jgi:hypothetical protein
VKPKLALLHVTCVLGRADDKAVRALAKPGKLDHVQIRPGQPERIPPAEARMAWQFRYASKGERDDAYERVRGLWWRMAEDRPMQRAR